MAGVVSEDEIDRAFEDRRLTRLRITRDVVAVLGVIDVFEACEVRRVVQRRRELRNPTADRLRRPAVIDDRRRDVALRLTAWSGVGVERERLARQHHGTVDLLGHQPDVLAGRRREAARGELRDHFLHAETLGLVGRHLRRAHLVGGAHRVGSIVGQRGVDDGLCRLSPVDPCAVAGGHDLRAAAAQPERRADGRSLGTAQICAHTFRHRLLVGADYESTAAVGHKAQHCAQLVGAQPRPRPVGSRDGQRRRRRAGGRAVDCSTHRVGRHRRRERLHGEIDRTGVVEPVVGQLVGSTLAHDAETLARHLRDRSGTAVTNTTLDGGLLQIGLACIERRVQARPIDVDDRFDVACASEQRRHAVEEAARLPHQTLGGRIGVEGESEFVRRHHRGPRWGPDGDGLRGSLL